MFAEVQYNRISSPYTQMANQILLPFFLLLLFFFVVVFGGGGREKGSCNI